MTRITRTGLFSVLVAAALRDGGPGGIFVEIGAGTIRTNITETLDFGPWSRPHVSSGRRVAQWKAERKGRRS